jgi:pantetheine-phosphate adenylyltransferase
MQSIQLRASAVTGVRAETPLARRGEAGYDEGDREGTQMRAVYPGTFDPFTNGHLDVVKRGLKLFGELTVAVADGGKKQALFPLDERVAMARAALDGLAGVVVEGFSGTLVRCLKEFDCRVVLRGLRTLSDYDYEVQMALFNRHLDPEVETVFVVASPEFAAVNSGLVREVASMGEDVSTLVPEPVRVALADRFGPPRKQ